jgi:hypothetical protein
MARIHSVYYFGAEILKAQVLRCKRALTRLTSTYSSE